MAGVKKAADESDDYGLCELLESSVFPKFVYGLTGESVNWKTSKVTKKNNPEAADRDWISACMDGLNRFFESSKHNCTVDTIIKLRSVLKAGGSDDLFQVAKADYKNILGCLYQLMSAASGDSMKVATDVVKAVRKYKGTSLYDANPSTWKGELDMIMMEPAVTLALIHSFDPHALDDLDFVSYNEDAHEIVIASQYTPEEIMDFTLELTNKIYGTGHETHQSMLDMSKKAMHTWTASLFEADKFDKRVKAEEEARAKAEAEAEAKRQAEAEAKAAAQEAARLAAAEEEAERAMDELDGISDMSSEGGDHSHRAHEMFEFTPTNSSSSIPPQLNTNTSSTESQVANNGNDGNDAEEEDEAQDVDDGPAPPIPARRPSLPSSPLVQETTEPLIPVSSKPSNPLMPLILNIFLGVIIAVFAFGLLGLLQTPSASTMERECMAYPSRAILSGMYEEYVSLLSGPPSSSSIPRPT